MNMLNTLCASMRVQTLTVQYLANEIVKVTYHEIWCYKCDFQPILATGCLILGLLL
jgi:hypothetical protein